MLIHLETRLSHDIHDTWILQLIGAMDQQNFDLMTAFESRTISAQLIQAQAKKLIIDLAATQRLGSQGRQFIMLLSKQLAGHDIRIVLKNPDPHLKRLLRLMQFDHIFDIQFDAVE
jgi:anti-anti-sigma factor